MHWKSSRPSVDVPVQNKEYIATLLCTREKKLHRTSLQFRFKKGAVTMGICSGICNFPVWGEPPAAKTYHQPSLHSHLIDCLERQAITPFAGKKKKPSRLWNSETFNVFCYCRQPVNDYRMIKCVVAMNGTTRCALLLCNWLLKTIKELYIIMSAEN